MTGRTYRMAADDAQAELDRFAAELAASIAERQAEQLKRENADRITALTAAAGIAAAGIKLTQKKPAKRAATVGGTYRMAANETQSAIDALAGELAASIAAAELEKLARERAARVAALVSPVGVQAADIKLTPLAAPAHRLNRQELILAAARGEVAALADDIAAAIESGTPVTPAPAPEPIAAPAGFWANYREGRRLAKVYRDAYVEALG